MKILLLLSIIALPIYLAGHQSAPNNPPQFLYKILSVENWQASQPKLTVQLSSDDEAFIHLATEDQLEKITAKYWSNASEYVILKIDTGRLPGRLVLEANPGGTNKYYHLYDGKIPLNAVVDFKVIKRSMK